jgi:hypothetical protein
MRKRTTSPGGRLMDLRTAAACVGCSYWTLTRSRAERTHPRGPHPEPSRARWACHAPNPDRLARSGTAHRTLEGGARLYTQPHGPYASVNTEGGTTNGHDVQTRRRLVGQVLSERPADQGVEPQQQRIRRDQFAEAPRRRHRARLTGQPEAQSHPVRRSRRRPQDRIRRERPAIGRHRICSATFSPENVPDSRCGSISP